MKEGLKLPVSFVFLNLVNNRSVIEHRSFVLKTSYIVIIICSMRSALYVPQVTSWVESMTYRNIFFYSLNCKSKPLSDPCIGVT